jgi:hypothetical protein
MRISIFEAAIASSGFAATVGKATAAAATTGVARIRI